MWEAILRQALGQLASARLDQPEWRELAVLAGLTAAAPLQRALGAMLHDEVLKAAAAGLVRSRRGRDAGREFQAGAALRALLDVGTLPMDATAQQYFTTLTAYPATSKAEHTTRVSAINQPFLLIFVWDSAQFCKVPYGSVLGLARCFTHRSAHFHRLGWFQVRALQGSIDRCQGAAHAVLERAVRQRGSAMEAVLAWLAAGAALNVSRTTISRIVQSPPGAKVLVLVSCTCIYTCTCTCTRSCVFKFSVADIPLATHYASPQKLTSHWPLINQDNFMLGLAAVCLRFCRPFLGGRADHLQRLHPRYLASFSRINLAGVRTLTGGTLPGDPSAPHPLFSPPSPPSLLPDPAGGGVGFPPAGGWVDFPPGKPHFVAECFFITQHTLHVALLPAVQMMELALKRAQAVCAHQGEAEFWRSAKYVAVEDCWMTMLGADPGLAGDACRFYLLQVT
jgi:hypothetical protein